MNERNQWKSDYNELSKQIRKQKQLVKETDRAFSAGLIKDGVTDFYRDFYYSNTRKASAETRNLWHDLGSASFKLLLLRNEANNMLKELPLIKERATAEWEAKHAK